MFRTCFISLGSVSVRELRNTASTLNDMLDLSNKEKPVPLGQLKHYLQTNVFPILESDAVDDRGDSQEIRSLLGQVLRDSVFSAHIIKASVGGGFMRRITSFIANDPQNTKCLSQMPSAQAVKIIELFTGLGVTDTKLYALLCSRLDYTELRDVGRVMFALGERDLHEININVVVPLYCGEQWVITWEAGRQKGKNTMYQRGQPAPPSANVYDAVRVLRMLSKSSRELYDRRVSLPLSSIELLRNNIIHFIFQHEDVLRGAHWINVCRALVYFPKPLQTMSLDSQSPLTTKLATKNGPVTCKAVGSLAADNVFKPSAFDCTPGDLIKLLAVYPHLLADEYDTAKVDVHKQRVESIVEEIVRHTGTMRATQSINFLKIVQSLDLPASFHTSIETVFRSIDGRFELVEENQAKRIPFRTLTDFSLLVSFFRMEHCPHFVKYLDRHIAAYPLSAFTVENADVLLTAMASLRHKPKELACHILQSTLSHYSTGGTPLVQVSPHHTGRILRAMVLLQICPSPTQTEKIFGGGVDGTSLQSEQEDISPVVFDISRSLGHFAKDAHASTSHRTDASVSFSQCEEALWKLGVKETLLVSLSQLTDQLNGVPPLNSYTPLCWRSFIRCVADFIDLDGSFIKLEAAEERIESIFHACCRLLTTQAVLAMNQNNRIRDSTSEIDLKQRRAYDKFSASCVRHYIYYVLMFEYLLFHGCWKAKTSLQSTRLSHVKSMYITTMEARLDGVNASPLGVLESIMGLEDGVKGVSLLSKEHVLDITTNLPFAISLQVDPGPASILFSELSVGILLGEDL
ncbi:hypothetical protein, conserved [Angomonas deanei]|uniref:Uncharacterized protein n=1 Tax=Angomonas deanei TaxID=59799 RepID=A0A7G2C6T8_9TRYP|nr:hypothetical protein, conserved [Angomonas deanei]